MRYALVQAGKVDNIVSGEGLGSPYVPCPPYVGMGWTFDGTTFSPPIQSRTWTSYEFLQRFTTQERRLIWNRAKNDDDVAEFLMFSQAANEVLSDDPATIAGMNTLVSKNILTASRKDQILNG